MDVSSDRLAPGELSRVFGRGLHFGAIGRRLFGMVHEPSSPTEPTAKVLVCPPFGQEAIRLHRFFRVLTERLAGRGVASLRFDYFGTGDSDGSDDDADYLGWMNDVSTAHALLTQLGPSVPVVWLGAGLGATIAMDAAAASSGPTRIIAWEPVVDGSGYLSQLRLRHVEALEASYSLRDPSWRRSLAKRPDAFTGEAVGFALPAPFRESVLALEPTRIGSRVPCEIDVIADPGNAQVIAWAKDSSKPIRSVTPLPNGFRWTSQEMNGTPPVPTDSLTALLATITS